MNKVQEDLIFKDTEFLPVPIDEQAVNDDGIPYVTHSGTLKFLGFNLRCYVLSDGRRIIDGEDMLAMVNEIGITIPGANE